MIRNKDLEGHGHSLQGKSSYNRMRRNYVNKNYDSLGNDSEKTCGYFKQKRRVKLNFFRSYIVNGLLEPAENNFYNGENNLKNHIIEISIEIIFPFRF